MIDLLGLNNNITLYFSDLLAYIKILPITKKVEMVSAIFAVISAFNILIIVPIAFNYFIIPRIEKRLGKKLKYMALIDYFLFGIYFYRSVEVFQYIFISYAKLKLGLGPSKITRTALPRARYDIQTASKFEIIMSFYAIINLLIWCLAGIFIFIF